jgi:hypothetical protein
MCPSYQTLQHVRNFKFEEDHVTQNLNLEDAISVRPVENQVIESQALMDEITLRPVESSILLSPPLMDEISVRLVENQAIETRALMDEITLRPVESSILLSPPLMDEISVRPVENQAIETRALMDEIVLRHVESSVLPGSQLVDEISVRPVENQATETHALLDEITIRPSLGPVNIEYELLDDLITKSARYRTKRAKPSSVPVITNPVESQIENAKPFSNAVISNLVESPTEKAGPISAAVITNPVESPVANPRPSSDLAIINCVEILDEKAKPFKTICVDEIAEVLNEKRDFRPSSIHSAAKELPNTPSEARIKEGIDNPSSQAKNPSKKFKLPRAVTKVLSASRIYNNNEFYLRDTDLANVSTFTPKPRIEDFTFKVLTTADELDELIDDGYDLVINFSKIKRGLKKGMVAFVILVDRELAFLAWACITEESKATFRGYPYNDDIDRQACIVGDWTNPRFGDSSISSYVKHKRQELLKDKGFSVERSIVEESEVKELYDVEKKKKSELTYKRRSYTNVSLPGILGVEFWKEQPLCEIDNKPTYQMITVLVLVLPSCPRMAIGQRSFTGSADLRHSLSV